MPEAPTMPETTSAPPPVTPNPSTARASQELFAKSDIRNTPEFKETFKAFRAKAKPPGSELGEPRTPRTPEKQIAPPPKPKPEPQPKSAPEFGEEESAQPEPEIPEHEETEPAETPETEEKTPDEKPEQPAPEKGKKVSPWRLVDEWKKKAAHLERELAEIKGKAIPEADSQQLTERLKQTEAKLKEYEEERRYTNYQKSEEFEREYATPYKTEYARVMKQLDGLPVQQADGTTRAVNATDILQLLSLPLHEMEAAAERKFGEYGGTVVRRVERLQELFDKTNDALENAKKNSVEWERERTEKTQKQQSEIVKQVTEAWEKFKNEPLTDGKYGTFFAPREGDQQWNQRLAKGFELVDKAFNDPNPRDPRLTPEDREKIVKRHAAVRARAAGWGALRYENESLKGKVAELEKALSEYKSTEPGSAGGSRSQTKPKTEPSDPWEKVRGGLRKYAKPM